MKVEEGRGCSKGPWRSVVGRLARSFFTRVCHCLGQAVSCQRFTSSTACSKQWHTGGAFPRVVRNAGSLP